MIRESRYTVLKNSDIQAALWHGYLTDYDVQSLFNIIEQVRRYREARSKDELKCVIVEDDWPEYEAVWDMISKRVDSNENTLDYQNSAV